MYVLFIPSAISFVFIAITELVSEMRGPVSNF
jgi:hypothetical protein